MGKNHIGHSFARKMSSRLPVEYYMLEKPEPDGKILGYFNGEPIVEAVMDRTGMRYYFAGIAPPCRDGSPDVQSLRFGEWIVKPGLIYLLRKAVNAA